MTQQSGQWQAKARTKGGRRPVRTTLHMPALLPITRDLKPFADCLQAKRKHSQTIITAVLRKLLVLQSRLVKPGRLWTEVKP